MKRWFIILILCFNSVHASDYFQQYVNYEIDARLVTSQNWIDATQKLAYVNNARDTLKQVYFHLYLNKYKEDAYTEYNTLRPRTLAYIDIKTLLVNGDKNNTFDIHKTLMQVNLKDPLAPGDTVFFYFDFRAKLPYASGRYGYMGDHYDVGNWFPTPVAYDLEGWHLHQHIDNEFYQEWGDFRVNITVPKGFIVGATGNLLNSEEAMKDTTREVRDWYLHNLEDTLSTTTWQYEAKNVHDFAWTADPEYRYITGHWDGIDIHYLVMRYNYGYWKNELKAGVQSMRFFSEQFGRYPYDQITIADTYINAGGMEYPGIVFINTNIDPVYRLTFFRAVIIHEIAHNWFYGLLGTNQTEFEWLDEGFTNFAEILAMEEIYGKKNNYYTVGYDWFSKTFNYVRDERTWNHYSSLRLVKSNREEDPVNTMPDHFRYGVYASQYDKMASILFMLENTMGKEAFWQGMRNYFEQWKYKHPQPNDFKHTMENAIAADLDWFFNQWLHSTRTLDYSLTGYDNVERPDGWQVTFKIRNLADIYMPFDILLKLENGDSLFYHIPVDYFFPKDASRKYLPEWHFSLKSYSASVTVPGKVKEIVIDPYESLLDINRLNNNSNFLPPIDFYFMKNQRFAPPIDAYLWEIWPGFFYNDVDKFKIGIANYAGYLNKEHLLNLKTWYKLNTYDLDFHLNYRHPLNIYDGAGFNTNIYRLDGRQGADARVLINFSKHVNMSLKLDHYRMFDERYSYYPWADGVVNGANIAMKYQKSAEQSDTVFELKLRNSLAGSAQNFSLARLDIRQSFYSRYSDYAVELNFTGGAADKNTPVQEKFNLAGANGLSEFNDAYYRARGSLPVDWRRKGHLYKSEYAAVRGVSLISDNYISDNILAGSINLKFPNIFSYIDISLLDFFDNALFFDAGMVWSDKIPDIRDSARSAGVSVSVLSINDLYYIFGLNKINVDFPLWTEYPAFEKNNNRFPWLISFEFNLDRNAVF